MTPNKLTEIILQALQCEDHPTAPIIEAVIEKEFDKYENLLKEIRELLVADFADDYAEVNRLVEKIDEYSNYA